MMNRMSTKQRTFGTDRTWTKTLGTSALASLLLWGSSVLWLGTAASAAKSPYGIVPLGSTNEGFPEGVNDTTTGILIISGGPCIGPAIKNRKADRLATRITLYHGAKEIAEWEIYGSQKIAWVEPVGNYSVSASDFRNGGRVHFTDNSSANATVNLNPGCL
jgi:hypothetical protein